MGAAKKQVMDVSKPGKAAAPATTRPLIVGHGSMVQDPMVRRANAQAALDAQEPGTQPKHEKIVLQPMSEGSAADDDVKSRFTGVTNAKVSGVTDQDADAADDPLMVATSESSEDTVSTKAAPVLPELAEDDAQTLVPDASADDADSDSTEQGTDTTVQASTTDDAASTDDSADAPNATAKPKPVAKLSKSSGPKAYNVQSPGNDDTPMSDDAASVDAVVSQASLKKASQDEDKKRKEQEAVYQKLVDDKTYFVRTGQPKASKAFRYVMSLIVLLLILGAAYVAADAGAFGNSIKVPFHVFPQSKDVGDTPAVTPAATPAPTPTPTTPVTPAAATALSQFTDAVLGLNFSYPTAWGTPAIEAGKLNDTGTESVKTYRITFKDLASAELRITQNNWTSSQKAPVLTPLDDDGFTAMSADTLAAPYLSISTTDDSYVLLAYATSDKTVQLQAAKKLTLRLIDAQYIEFYGTPVAGGVAQTCTTAATTSTGATTRLPSKDCATKPDIKDVQNLVASMKAS